MSDWHEALAASERELGARYAAGSDSRGLIQDAIEHYMQACLFHLDGNTYLGAGGNDSKEMARFIGRCLTAAGFSVTR
ncbi:hypothetical protein CH249_14405 [Rhodococcus sp. 05-2255-3B1]|uniref:hypothetical protein n=1 Tax=unclassified Rhodococcus (in: high G+C Gram-positive bacteria) TaxID=192944 RepID=UPI000B9ADE87|nr:MULTISPECIES: hypothetical protein [unclassified Rhodococcus (in: high G+C Gram-positive bacteria)]OZE10091.1 hypothetical protein CH249_14405 [Rhodococcus sp. 05-2255-3B1]OZE10268.1 hypothetical protein CH250_13325 [Rhodococcus sp. 05-2255-3C]OZE24395.1 hypothetical protein CH255_01980 [Rhodococcus sp. 05-2255-2A2]